MLLTEVHDKKMILGIFNKEISLAFISCLLFMMSLSSGNKSCIFTCFENYSPREILQNQSTKF